MRSDFFDWQTIQAEKHLEDQEQWEEEEEGEDEDEEEGEEKYE